MPLAPGELTRWIVSIAGVAGNGQDELFDALAFGYLQHYCRATGLHLIFSAHDINQLIGAVDRKVMRVKVSR